MNPLFGYLKGANEGDAAAQLKAGEFLEAGKGATQDYQEAVRWYRASAISGDPQAQIRLANLISEGHGTDKSLVLAHAWANIAGSRGSEEGRQLRDKLAKKLSPAEIDFAQKLAKGWQPGSDVSLGDVGDRRDEARPKE